MLSRLKALDKFVLEVEAKYRSNRVPEAQRDGFAMGRVGLVSTGTGRCPF